MKVIFESEKEKKEFIEDMYNSYCPSIIGLVFLGCLDVDCKKCWEEALKEVEVKENENHI